MPSNLTVASAVLKVGYGDMHEQLDDYVVGLKMVEKGSKHITDGNYEAQFDVHTQRNWGIGARNEYEDLPDAGSNKDARASVYLKYQYGRIQGTGQVFKQVSTKTQSFVDWMKREIDTIKDTLRRDLNRQIYGDGTGTMALLTATATAATTLTVDASLWLEVGQTLDVLTQATLGNPTPTKGNTALLTVTDVNTTTNVITVTGGTVTAAIGSALVQAGTTANNWKKEWEGLGSIVSTTSTLHNIAPATETRWKAGYIENSVGVLAEIDLTHLTQAIHKQGTKVTDLLTTYGVVNAYWNTLQGLRRYSGNETLTGGDGSVKGESGPVFQSVFGDLPISMDWACPAGTMYALNKEEMFLNQTEDWSWIDETGSMWQQVPNKDAFSATIKKYSNIGVYRRNAFGKLTGITEV